MSFQRHCLSYFDTDLEIANETQGYSYTYLSGTEITSRLLLLAFPKKFWGLNSGLYSGKANTFLTELSLQPRVWYSHQLLSHSVSFIEFVVDHLKNCEIISVDGRLLLLLSLL